jgi:hypothetical protein
VIVAAGRIVAVATIHFQDELGEIVVVMRTITVMRVATGVVSSAIGVVGVMLGVVTVTLDV